eukprot:2730753-Prymnesium_polylepis.1
MWAGAVSSGGRLAHDCPSWNGSTLLAVICCSVVVLRTQTKKSSPPGRSAKSQMHLAPVWHQLARTRPSTSGASNTCLLSLPDQKGRNIELEGRWIRCRFTSFRTTATAAAKAMRTAPKKKSAPPGESCAAALDATVHVESAGSSICGTELDSAFTVSDLGCCESNGVVG